MVTNSSSLTWLISCVSWAQGSLSFLLTDLLRLQIHCLHSLVKASPLISLEPVAPKEHKSLVSKTAPCLDLIQIQAHLNKTGKKPMVLYFPWWVAIIKMKKKPLAFIFLFIIASVLKLSSKTMLCWGKIQMYQGVLEYFMRRTWFSSTVGFGRHS